MSSAPGIFQRTMESLLNGIPNVLVYLDDILVTGHTKEQHFSNLHEVLLHFCQAGLRLKKQKCQFLVKSINYLGYTIDQKGIHPFEGKVKAVKAAPNPKNLTEDESLPGVTYLLWQVPSESS